MTVDNDFLNKVLVFFSGEAADYIRWDVSDDGNVSFSMDVSDVFAAVPDGDMVQITEEHIDDIVSTYYDIYSLSDAYEYDFWLSYILASKVLKQNIDASFIDPLVNEDIEVLNGLNGLFLNPWERVYDKETVNGFFPQVDNIGLLKDIILTTKHVDNTNYTFMWQVDRENNKIFRIAANCSDVFYWGTSDAEVITDDNFHVLEETVKDLEKLNELDPSTNYVELFVSDLFAAKVRQLRPQGVIFYS